MQTTAETAKEIRNTLKTTFPAVKFSVKKRGNSVDVDWTDGASYRAVERITAPFARCEFDGMTDSDIIVNRNSGARFVLLHHSFSDAFAANVLRQLKADFGWQESVDELVALWIQGAMPHDQKVEFNRAVDALEF